MAESRYEKYIVRKAAIITEDGQEIVPERILVEGRADTGPLVLCSPSLIKETDQFFEYGIISGGITVGSGPGDRQRSINNDNDEFFIFGERTRKIQVIWGRKPSFGWVRERSSKKL